jgi:alkylhydroperoxidase family enzyme
VSFLAEVIPPPGFFDDDLAELGFVMNASRLWAYQPQWQEQIFDVLGSIVREHGLTVRQRGILVAACASTLGDSYCSLAWGTKLARATNPDLAAAVLHGDDHALTPAEQALATWTRHITEDPNATTLADVDLLRETGWTDPQIFGITVFAALRIAFSTVNDALGAHPDANYRTLAPAAVLAAVTFGRALETDVEVA